MSERYQRIQAMKQDYGLSELCAAFEVSRSGYYAWRERAPSTRQAGNARLLEAIHTIRAGEEVWEEVCYGSPRMTEELQAPVTPAAKTAWPGLMRAHGLQAQAGRRWVPRTTDSQHDEPIAPNRLAERPAPDGPNQVWLQDITYVPTQEGWLYLALVLDLWSRKIVGWAMADHLRSELVSALQMAQTPAPANNSFAASSAGTTSAGATARSIINLPLPCL